MLLYFLCFLSSELSLFAHVLILVTDKGSVYSTFEDQPLTPLRPVLHEVDLVAFDWLTDTLYWTNHQLNLVSQVFNSIDELHRSEVVTLTHGFFIGVSVSAVT